MMYTNHVLYALSERIAIHKKKIKISLKFANTGFSKDQFHVYASQLVLYLNNNAQCWGKNG